MLTVIPLRKYCWVITKEGMKPHISEWQHYPYRNDLSLIVQQGISGYFMRITHKGSDLQTVDSTKIETYFKSIEPRHRTQSLPIEITSRKPVIALKFMIDQDQSIQTMRVQLFFKDTISFNQCLDLIQDSQLLDPSLQTITSQLPLTFLTQDIDGSNSNSFSNSNSNLGDPQDSMSYSTRSTFWEPQFQPSQNPPDLRKIILLKLQDPNFVKKVKHLENVISDILN